MKPRVLVLAACTSGCLAGVAWVFVAGPTSLTPFEEGFVATSVAGQVLFLVALTTSARQLTDVCHVAMVLSLFVGAAVVTNAWVLGLLLACLVAVQGLWIVYGRCIVNDGPAGWFPAEHGYGKYSEAAALALTATVGTKFGWSLHALDATGTQSTAGSL
jgi:hypothetical protein